MIRATGGFGVVDDNGIALWFDDIQGSFARDTGPVANGGYAIKHLFGLGYFGRTLGASAFWCVGFDWQPNFANGYSGGGWVNNNFLQIGQVGASQLSLEFLPSGKIAVVYGGDGSAGSGTIVNMTMETYTPQQWAGYFEFRCSGFMGNTVFQLWRNDTLVCHGTQATTALPDTITFASNTSISGFGVEFANIIILDNQGPAPWNDRLGPVAITTMSPIADASGQWLCTINSMSFGPPIFSAVRDVPFDPNGSPDCAYSYIYPGSTAAEQYFTMNPAACFGLVLGVMVNMCFRGYPTYPAFCTAQVQVAGATTVIGQSQSNYAAGGSYPFGFHTFQQFIGLNPSTSTNWNAAGINGAFWGMAADVGAQVTQFYIEQIVSRRNVKYDCGQSSYSF